MANHLGFCELAGLPDFSELGFSEHEPLQDSQALDLHDSFVLDGFEDFSAEGSESRQIAETATLAEPAAPAAGFPLKSAECQGIAEIATLGEPVSLGIDPGHFSDAENSWAAAGKISQTRSCSSSLSA